MDPDLAMSDVHHGDNDGPGVDLPALTFEERNGIYKLQFCDDVPLHEIAAPKLCELYPDLTDEIVDAYLTRTTFVVRVWANYDAAGRVYFHDRRLQDCGKLDFTAKQRRRVDAIPSTVDISNVRFDIGTPFRTLTRLTVAVRPNVRGGPPHIDAFLDHGACRLHSEFVRELQACVQDMRAMNVTNGKDGFNVADLEGIAGWFVKPPPPTTPKPSSAFGYARSKWFDHDEENKGYMSHLSGWKR